MPLRFLNYTNLLYQRRYRDHRWRKGDIVEPVLHVVLYNGGTRWDAPRRKRMVCRGRTDNVDGGGGAQPARRGAGGAGA